MVDSSQREDIAVCYLKFWLQSMDRSALFSFCIRPQKQQQRTMATQSY